MLLYKQIFRLLLIILGLHLSFAASSPNCINSYSEIILPNSCDPQTKTCDLTNLSQLIITNTTTANQTFVLCLNLPSYNITIQGGSDNLGLSVYIEATTIILSSYLISTPGSIVLISSVQIQSQSSNLTAHLVWMQSNNVVILNSTLKLQELFDTSCNCLEKGAQCQFTPYYFPFLYSSVTQSLAFNMQLMNYTYDTWNFFGASVNSILITANNSINIESSILRISVIGMYSSSINIYQSSINTTGLGFPSGTGYGCGYFNELLNQLLGCSGTGGSYGGFGGNSNPQGCNLLFSNPPYSRQLIPKYPGSGGGFFLRQVTEVSSGGGVINMQAQTMSIMNSSLLSNGVGGIQGGGGGAGGSISMDFYVMMSNYSIASANGGAGKSSGSGGRIRFWDQNWKTYSTASLSNMKIQVMGGPQCDSSLTCGLNGSIISSPCPPGYQTNLTTLTCQVCNNGTYQLVYGYVKCFPCKSKPSNSNYSGEVDPNLFSNYTEVCEFACNPRYNKYNNRQCLTNFEIALVNVGGYNLLISFGIIIASLIIFLILTMVRKLSYNDSNALDQSDHIDYYKKKSYFKIQDIPFHQIRIYFQGENTPQKPWRISQNVQDNIRQFYQQNEEKVLTLTRLIKQLNELSEYPKRLSVFLFALKLFYYPLSLVFAQAFRERKSKNVRRAVIAKAKNLQVDTGVKFHVNQFYTVGCLQIFNYRKQTLDFYIKNYFPIYFKLQRLLIGGYSIDNTDPLLKALYSQFQDRGSKKLQKFLIQLNHLLRSQDIAVYKHLWKITEIYPVLQCYLWQPPKIMGENQMMPVQGQLNGVMGMENRFTIKKDVDLFLVFSIQGKAQSNHSLINPINISQVWQNRLAQSKFSKHFYYVTDLPNIYYDEISCIRHKYNLREAMIQFEEKKNVFWEIQNGFSQKYLSWALGSISILSLLLNLLAFFIFVFLLVELKQISSVFALLSYFVIFPFCQFFMIVSQFKLIISKGYKTMTYSIYFTLFTIIKNIVIMIILIIIGITFGFGDVAFFILFLIWIFLLILQVFSLVLLCMLNARITKAK